MRRIATRDLKVGHRVAGLSISSFVKLSQCTIVTFEDGSEIEAGSYIEIDNHEPPQLAVVYANTNDPWSITDPNAQRGGLYGADKFFNTGGR